MKWSRKPMKLIESESASASPASWREDEALILSRIALKDMQAFEVLYRAYYRRLTRFLEQVTRRPQLIEEILDDTMLVVWGKAGTFNGQSQVSTWIFAIAYNKAMKALKRLRVPLEATDEDAASAADGPEEALMKRQTKLHLQGLLGRLSTEQRAVIELTYYQGCSYKEIARIVGCPADTVKTRMFYARRKLREMLLAQSEGAM
jgi:RNA polymerase sigma-70 factor (ECF subfamily)